MQHSWLHLCLPQLRFFVHFFLHRASSARVDNWEHLIIWSILPHRHFTAVCLLHGGQGPAWHLLTQLWGLLGWPHVNRFLHADVHNGIGSLQLVRWSFSICVFPHGHVFTMSGRSSQSPQSPSWQSFLHLWLPHWSCLLQTRPQE